MTRGRKQSMLFAGAWLLAACAHGGAAGDSLPPNTRAVTTAPATTAPASSTSSTASTTSTSPSTTSPASTTAVPTLQLSDDGPWRRVDSAPGITTPGLVYELMPKLWVYLPTQEDIPHGIVWTLHDPADIPVIEAYLRARLVYFRAITTDPIDLTSPDWDLYYADHGEMLIAPLTPRRDRGESATLDAGVVLRPEVIGDERSSVTAVVFDCVLDGGYFMLANGSLSPGSVKGVVKDGIAFRMRADGGNWRVADWGNQPEAC